MALEHGAEKSHQNAWLGDCYSCRCRSRQSCARSFLSSAPSRNVLPSVFISLRLMLFLFFVLWTNGLIWANANALLSRPVPLLILFFLCTTRKSLKSEGVLIPSAAADILPCCRFPPVASQFPRTSHFKPSKSRDEAVALWQQR